MSGRVEDVVRCRKAYAVLSVALGLAFACPVSSVAQYTARQPTVGRHVVVELGLPRFGDVTYSGVVGKGAFVTPLNPRVTLVTGLSVAYAKEPGLSASVAISNIFASVVFGGEDGFGTLTLTIPTTGRLTNQGYAVSAGLLADLERAESYTPRTTGVELLLSRRWHLGSEARFGGFTGPALVSPSGFQTEIYGRFGGFIESLVGPTRLGVEATGSAFLRQSGRSVSEASVYNIRAYVGLPNATAAPDLFVRIPLDEASRIAIDLLVGLRLSF